MTTKRKTWGRVAAKPSEYMIVLRGGRIVAHGSGLSVFVWPGSTYTILPTTIQRVAFVADQVTAEKVGVEVRGIGVFRVADPVLAFRVLDFDGNDAVSRVGEILRDMFVGAARRLVANMTVEGCLTRRKEQIAAELMREISPVVAGEGRPDDPTDRGWGLVLDSIEIQDVRILSETVFSNLQAPYRAAIEMRARESSVQRDREVHLREVEAAHATLEADQKLDQRRSEVDEGGRLQAIERTERQRQAEVESARRLALSEHDLDVERAELEATLASLRHEHQRKVAKDELEAELELLDSRLAIDRRRGELATELKRWGREVDNLVTDERIRYELVTGVLPVLAEALGEHMGEVRVTHLQTGDVGGWLGGIVSQLVGLGKSLGGDEQSKGGRG